MYGSPKDLILAKDGAPAPKLSSNVTRILDHMIKETAPLYWKDFIQLVYSTYPVVSQPRYTDLDLPVLALEYESDLMGH